MNTGLPSLLDKRKTVGLSRYVPVRSNVMDRIFGLPYMKAFGSFFVC